MVGTVIGCTLLALLALVALARVARMQRRTRANIATLADYERRIKDAAREVTVLATELGPARREYHAVRVSSAGFDLRLSDGQLVRVEPGVHVDLFTRDAKVHDGIATLPPATRLWLLPPDAPGEAAPYKRAGAVAYTRGDALLLFARDAILFALPGRQRRTSIPRMIASALLVGVTIVLCASYGPNTRWNALLFVLAIVLVTDQVLARGVFTWIACTRPPPPLATTPYASDRSPASTST